MTPDPLVSLLVPCRNEAPYIVECLESLLTNGYPLEQLEILVVDGGSTDGTAEVVAGLARRHGAIRLLSNPRQVTPAALNLGLEASRGKIVMLVGAHSEYPPGYIRGLVDALVESGADAVGGVCETRASGTGAMARAIAVALSHPFGVGNAWFRIGSRERRWVDTVPFGCYRRDVFTRVGGFDEALIRNQDDEFNLRLRKHGGRLLLVPSVTSRYFARTTLRQVVRMYYQYGLFKPAVVRKVGAVMTVRQVVPAALVLGLGLAALLTMGFSWGWVLLLGVVATYVLADIVAAVSTIPAHGVATLLSLLMAFPALHLSYGIGFLVGIVRPSIGHGRNSPPDVPLSR